MFQGKKVRDAQPQEAAASTNGASADASSAKGEAKNLPLFFQSPAVVDSGRHANAGIKTSLPPAFARSSNCILLNAPEFVEAAKFYPIVFTIQAPLMPLAVVGLEKENIFIGKDNSWRENTYIPAYVRKFPFALYEEPGSDRAMLCVDEESAYFVKDAGAKDKDVTRLFEDGKPTAYATQALNFCILHHQEHQLTRRFCDMLQEMDLLEASVSNVELATGRKVSLAGFNRIDPKKFQALPEKSVTELLKQGWLPFIYYALQSATNWVRLMNATAAMEKAA